MEAWQGSTRLDLRGHQSRALLAALMVHANRVVPADRLITVLWGTSPPKDARHNLQVRVSQLRRLLARGGEAPDRIQHREPGYELRVAPGEVDLDVFRRLADQGRQALAAADPQQAAGLLTEALGLWRGSAMQDVNSPVLAEDRDRLDRRRLAAWEDRLEADLRLARHTDVVEELEELVTRYPLRQRLWAQLMLALYRCGRQDEALDAYARARAVLAESTGLDPGPELSRLERAILTADPRIAAPEPQIRPAAVRRPAGRRLPRAVTDFTGRATEVRRLIELGRAATEPVVAALNGMPGVGKTTVALYVAHRLAADFPDGQIHLDLHGHTPRSAPLPPGEALMRLLTAIGVPEPGIPAHPEERAARWRAELAERRTLLVLDNAADSAQVEPLLPGSGRHMVIVTSRRRLTGLHDARHWSLAPLPQEDAVRLFATIAGIPETVGMVTDVVASCGFLPLAIRIVAARLRHRPAWTLAHLKELLADAGGTALLRIGDGRIESAFALSYRDLTDTQRRVFRLLGLLPGHDWDARAAAALAGLSPAEAEHALENLLDGHLLDQHVPGRYHFHNLLHQHARALSEREDGPIAGEQAVRRVLDHYRNVAASAARRIDPNRWRPLLSLETTEEGCGDVTEALAWFDAEHRNITAAIREAARRHWHEHTWQLAYLLWRYFNRRGHLDDWIAVAELGVRAAERLGDRRAHAAMLNVLGIACDRGGRPERAVGHYRACLAVLRGCDDPLAEADVHNNLGIVHSQLGADEQALLEYRTAGELYRRIERPYDAAMAISNLGEILTRVGCLPEAMACHLHARRAAGERGDHAAEAMALTNLGHTLALLGRHREALDHYERSLALRRRIGATYESGHTLIAMAAVHHSLGDHTRAEQCRREALSLIAGAGDRAGQALAAAGFPPLPVRATPATEALRRKATEIFTRLYMPDQEGTSCAES